MVEIHSQSELLSERTALANTAGTPVMNEVPAECPSCWPFLIVGLLTGSILGTGFALMLQKERDSKP